LVRYVLLRDTEDEGGSRQLSARLTADSALLIEGRDFGPGVERFFGPGQLEYEWALSISPPEISKLQLALMEQEDVLAALESRFSGEASAELQAFLDDTGIQYGFWSRSGE